MTRSTALVTLLLALFPVCAPAQSSRPIDIGSRLDLFVDRLLIGSLRGDARLTLHEPRDEGVAITFDKPWEGPLSHYATVLHDGDVYRFYYRGLSTLEKLPDGTRPQVTCYAESTDGIHWTKPSLGLVEIDGSTDNNVVLAHPVYSHNFSPFIDTNPDAPADQRYKALTGGMTTGLVAYVSADGVQWRLLRDEPVIPWREGDRGLDSQNVAFWSEHEQRYVAYVRLTPLTPDRKRIRAVARTTSKDFVHWSDLEMMTYSDTDSIYPSNHLYTNQTAPYFRAPHIYLATAACFVPDRQVVSEDQARALGQLAPDVFARDSAHPVLLTSRGGTRYDRVFPQALIKPGIGVTNWTSRTNYPALNIVPTGETEMSMYLNQDVAFPTAHLRRYSMRLDGLASIRAGHKGGELITKPLTFTGDRLVLNVATSAAGGVVVEIQDAAGKPIPGFTEADCVEVVGNEIERVVTWAGDAKLSDLAGQPVRLRFVLTDADLYSLRFQ